MKTRTGFVSNSSSSSFVCNVCGTAESGMDASPSDFEMSECTNGHIFCNSHAEDLFVDYDKFREYILEYIKSDKYLNEEEKKEKCIELDDTSNDDLIDYMKKYLQEYGYGVPECQCPICSFSSLNPKNGFDYLKKTLTLTDEKILSEIRGRFKNYKEFREFLKTN